MSEEQNLFKITDRRLFNPDGSLRDDAPITEREAVTQEPTLTSTAAQPALENTSAPDSLLESELTGSEVEADLDDEPLPGSDDPASFISFVMSIASNAAASLGMMEHPATGRRSVDLQVGKHWIDVLGMLQSKTRGNLKLQEQQALDDMLTDLRLQYVELTRTTAEQARNPQAFSGKDILSGR